MSKQQHDQDEQRASSSDAGQSQPATENSVPRPAQAAHEKTRDESGKASSSKDSRPRSRGRRGGKPSHQDRSSQLEKTGSPLSGQSEDGLDRPGQDKPGQNKSAAADAISPSSPTAKDESKSTPAASAGAPAKTSASVPSSRPDTGKSSGDATAGDSGKSSIGGAPPFSRNTAAQSGGGGGGKAGIIALVLVILLAIGVLLAGWWGWQQLNQRLSQQQQSLVDAADGAELAQRNADTLSSLQSQLDDMANQRQQALSDIRQGFEDYRGEVNDTLDKVLEELSKEQEPDEREWLHAEAAYLLRLANQRLELEGDVQGSAALLRTADKRLQEADNPALTAVRREISSELAALDSVPEIDRTGIYLALDAQQEQLAKLPLKQDIDQMPAPEAEEAPPTGSWKQQLSQFGNELKDLVTVRRHDEALEAMIAPDQEGYLRQNVRLKLEQAQLALLDENEELYEASIESAITLVNRYYATDKDAVSSALERLNELKDKAVRPELPDISGSQQALSRFIEKRFESQGNQGQASQAGQGDKP